MLTKLAKHWKVKRFSINYFTQLFSSSFINFFVFIFTLENILPGEKVLKKTSIFFNWHISFAKSMSTSFKIDERLIMFTHLLDYLCFVCGRTWSCPWYVWILWPAYRKLFLIKRKAHTAVINFSTIKNTYHTRLSTLFLSGEKCI